MREQRAPKAPRLALDGVLLLDKPAGLSSNDALIRAKRLLHAKKAGHTGTLDPFATGLLPICFGEATKFSQDLLDADKTYEARICLGVKTDTGDTEGEVIQTCDISHINRSAIDVVLKQFSGPIKQIPPMYSALKRDGKPLYAYARAGITLEREARDVTIARLVCLSWDAPYLTICVTCSKGTYVRVLGEDIGEALGACAHLEQLRRTHVGKLTLSGAVTLDEIEAMADAARQSQLAPVDYLLSSFLPVYLNDTLADRFMNGQRLPIEKEGIDTLFDVGRRRIYRQSTQQFLGTAIVREDRVLAPERLLNVHAMAIGTPSA